MNLLDIVVEFIQTFLVLFKFVLLLLDTGDELVLAPAFVIKPILVGFLFADHRVELLQIPRGAFSSLFLEAMILTHLDNGESFDTVKHAKLGSDRLISSDSGNYPNQETG